MVFYPKEIPLRQHFHPCMGGGVKFLASYLSNLSHFSLYASDEFPTESYSLWVSGITSRATESYFTSFLSVPVHFNMQNIRHKNLMEKDLLQYS